MSVFKDGGIFSQRDLMTIKWLRIQEETKLPEVDRTWWELRAYQLAEDKDTQCGNLPLLAGLLLRRN